MGSRNGLATSALRAADARVDGQDDVRDVGEITALDELDHGRDVGERRRPRPEPLQVLRAVGLDVVDDLTARLFEPGEGFARGVAAGLVLQGKAFALRHLADHLVDEVDRLPNFAHAHDHPSQAIAGSLKDGICLLYTSPSPRDRTRSRMPSSA